MLTDQQDTFARAIAAGDDKASAAAAAYPAASRASQARHARRLLKAPRVQERIAELSCQPRAAVLPRAGVSDAIGADNVAALDLAGLVAVAFDANQPDLLRLAALRRLDAALATAAREARARGEAAVSVSIAVSISVRRTLDRSRSPETKKPLAA